MFDAIKNKFTVLSLIVRVNIIGVDVLIEVGRCNHLLDKNTCSGLALAVGRNLLEKIAKISVNVREPIRVALTLVAQVVPGNIHLSPAHLTGTKCHLYGVSHRSVCTIGSVSDTIVLLIIIATSLIFLVLIMLLLLLLLLMMLLLLLLLLLLLMLKLIFKGLVRRKHIVHTAC